MGQKNKKLTKSERRLRYEQTVKAIDCEIARKLGKEATAIKYHLLKKMGDNRIPPHHWVAFNDGTRDCPYSIEQEAYLNAAKDYLELNLGEPLPIPYQNGAAKLDVLLVSDHIKKMKEIGFGK